VLRVPAKIKSIANAKLTGVNDIGGGADPSSQACYGKNSSMRTDVPQTLITPVPAPGTTEALELGCTCQIIAHESASLEREPAGLLIDPNPNCPLHGTNQDGNSMRAI
jgi:hypothetical protein